MKRALADSETLHCTRNHAKRHKTHPAGARGSRTSSLSSKPSLLTEEALDLFQRSLSSDDNPENMEALPTPRSTSSRGRARRPARSRTLSPSKKPSPQTYRTQNLHHANVFIDALPDLPPPIDDAVRHILGITSWDEQPAAPEQHLHTIAAWYQAESQRNTRNVSIEGDWKFSLFGLLRHLSDPFASDLKAHMSDEGRSCCICFLEFTLLCLPRTSLELRSQAQELNVR
jgi:hypothetical protein